MASQSANLWLLLGLSLAGILLMTTIKEEFGTFIEKLKLLLSPQPAPPKASYPLTGLTFPVSHVEIKHSKTNNGRKPSDFIQKLLNSGNNATYY